MLSKSLSQVNELACPKLAKEASVSSERKDIFRFLAARNRASAKKKKAALFLARPETGK